MMTVKNIEDKCKVMIFDQLVIALALKLTVPPFDKIFTVGTFTQQVSVQKLSFEVWADLH